MKDRSKKFLTTHLQDPTHIGNLVHWYIKERNLKKKDIAQQLDITPTTLNQYYKQPSLQTIILWRLSMAINFNFLMYLGEKLNVAFETQLEKSLKQQLLEKETQLNQLTIELNLLKKMYKIE